MDMFYQDEDVALSIEEEPTRRTSLTYDEVVKDLIHEEKQYIRDLNMIIKVFCEPFVKIFPKSKVRCFSFIIRLYCEGTSKNYIKILVISTKHLHGILQAGSLQRRACFK